MMAVLFRRALFWRVYATLFASLVLVAVLGAVLWRFTVGAGRVPAMAGHHLMLLLGTATAVGLAAFPVVSRLTRRLEVLRSSVETWGEGRLGVRAPVEGGDEIAAVAASFNAAADRVETLLDAHRSLLAHASHELRSPLARLRLAAEMLVAAPSPERLPAISREIEELDALVDEILLASRLDHAADVGAAGIVDLLALAAEESARAGVELRPVAAGAPSFEVTGSARLLRRLIRNLIENAVQHGGAPVEVELGRVGTGATARVAVTVRDHGPGVPEAEREQVFEPFYRPAGRGETGGGWGLGLSLVRQIAGRHGGTVRCEAAAGDGASFVAELPACDAGPG